MKIELTVTKEFDVRYLQVNAGVRYWEDATVNGIDDENGKLMPCKVNDRWQPLIDLETGIILNWESGKTAKIHYKVCDDGVYELLTSEHFPVKKIEGYVIEMLYPKENGYGDYIIMDIDEDGKIANWKPSFDEFTNNEDDY